MEGEDLRRAPGLTDHRVVPEVLEPLGVRASRRGPLAEITLGFHVVGERVQAASRMVADLLEGQGIDIVRSFSTESHVDLLVPSHQAIRAVALIDGLARELADPTWRRA